MDLDNAEPGLTSPASGGGKSGDYFFNAIACEGLRHRIIVSETQRARSDDFFPTAFVFGNGSRSFPWPARAGFATGMSQLHSGDAPLFINETNNSTEHLDMAVGPDAEVLRTDASFRKNGRCFGQNQSRTSDGATSKMNQMPVVRVSVVARILTHRRDEHPIGKVQISNRERIKQAGHCSYKLSVIPAFRRSQGG